MMRKHRGFRASGWVAGAVVLGVALVGCSAPAVQVSDLERAASADDALPAAVTSDMTERVDVETVRFVGERAGFRVYLGESTDEGYCIVLTGPDGTDGRVGCGGGGGVVDNELQVEQNAFRSAADGVSPGDDWEAISENVYYREVPIETPTDD
ncbi:hypothetical protein SAMN06309945_0535 [Okibacterium fritillariae]|uniref:Lipoprotein n=2 Tax=Okibacterium fritillariae TaxID=123320 RepID=A0A1T5IJU4_9MICO|nr:hypothetical protein SAMN06309945_0535 [Okibacterium fritillariae]